MSFKFKQQCKFKSKVKVAVCCMQYGGMQLQLKREQHISGM